MFPYYRFSDSERKDLLELIADLPENPYQDYLDFADSVRDLVDQKRVPRFFVALCEEIRKERCAGTTHAHLIENLPIDHHMPPFDHQAPLEDKYSKKKTFIGEAVLQLFATLTRTPLLAYSTRNNADFFHDVYAMSRYSNTQTQKTDGDLYFHNDRTAHDVRADYLTLLGMRCPEENVFTLYVDGREVVSRLDRWVAETLRQPCFVTPFDRLSRDSNSDQAVSEAHPILESGHHIRYHDTRTRVADGGTDEAYRALIALRDAITKSPKQAHRMREGDLLSIANRAALHNRTMLDIRDQQAALDRWLLKTYAFEDEATLNRWQSRWHIAVPGLIAD